MRRPTVTHVPRTVDWAENDYRKTPKREAKDNAQSEALDSGKDNSLKKGPGSVPVQEHIVFGSLEDEAEEHEWIVRCAIG